MGGCGGDFVDEGLEAWDVAEELRLVALFVGQFSGGVDLDMVRTSFIPFPIPPFIAPYFLFQPPSSAQLRRLKRHGAGPGIKNGERRTGNSQIQRQHSTPQ